MQMHVQMLKHLHLHLQLQMQMQMQGWMLEHPLLHLHLHVHVHVHMLSAWAWPGQRTHELPTLMGDQPKNWRATNPRTGGRPTQELAGERVPAHPGAVPNELRRCAQRSVSLGV